MRSNSVSSPARLVAGVSLKMYLTTEATRAWLSSVARLAPLPLGVELFVLPAFPYLRDAQEVLRGTEIAHGAQDVWYEPSGPFTGEVSPQMLWELGCTYVEVGHFERRELFGEDSGTVARKARAAVEHGLIPIVCVGEGAVMPVEQARRSVVEQLLSSIKGVPDGPLIVAYEPSWAIGAEEPAPAEHVVMVSTAIRETLAARTSGGRLLYGGTAGPGMLTALQEQSGTLPVDGLFLGRRAHDVQKLSEVLFEMSAVISAAAEQGSGELADQPVAATDRRVWCG